MALSFPTRLFLSWKEIWSGPDLGRLWSCPRQPLLSCERASHNQHNVSINCNFRQASSKHLIAHEPKAYLFFFKIVIKTLVSERLAWVLARWARREGKLLARRENLLVPDDRTGFFSSPVFTVNPIWLVWHTYISHSLTYPLTCL